MEILVHREKLDRDRVIPVIKDAWSLPENATVPRNIMGPMVKELGIDDFFIGAFDGDTGDLLGFVVAFGRERDPDEVNIYMLGIRKRFQSSGLGFELMDTLREELLKAGKTRATFTMDPFDTKCANLYFHKLHGIGVEYRKEPVSVPEPACKEDFPHRYFKVSWSLDELNPDKEMNYSGAVKHLPKVRTTYLEHDEFLIEMSASFQEKLQLFCRIANGEFKRLSGMFEHFVNRKGYRVVDLLYQPGEMKAYYKLKKM